MLDKVTILITTFLRPGYLQICEQYIKARLPEVKTVTVADDNWYSWFRTEATDSHWIEIPFDSGLTAKRNAGVKQITTPYTLLASDDYNFSPSWVREGVKMMAETLDAHPEIDVVVGTYNGKRYEGFLELVPGEYIKEHRLSDTADPLFVEPHPAWKIDIGINYFLARTEVLREIPWDESIRPIGGEHGDWFMSLKEAGKLVVYVPGCNVENIPGDASMRHSDYMAYRRRAHLGHEAMLKKRQIKHYYGFEENPQ